MIQFFRKSKNSISLRGTKGYNKFVARFIVVLSVVVCIIFFSIISSTKASGDTRCNTKYFRSIEVKNGDTLWSIAEEYMSNEHYESITDYIYELKKMNGLHNDDITSGCYLVVAYYSDEIK